MFLNNEQQFYLFLWSFVPGLVIGLLYVILEAVRVISPPDKIQLFVGDLLFMLAASMITFLFSVAATEGRIRFHMILAEIISFTLLYFTVGKFLINFLVSIMHTVHRVKETMCRKFESDFVKIVDFCKKIFARKKKSKKN